LLQKISKNKALKYIISISIKSRIYRTFERFKSDKSYKIGGVSLSVRHQLQTITNFYQLLQTLSHNFNVILKPLFKKLQTIANYYYHNFLAGCLAD